MEALKCPKCGEKGVVPFGRCVVVKQISPPIAVCVQNAFYKCIYCEFKETGQNMVKDG